ncbi:PAS domain-containing protein [Palleronia sediminis]|nr:PAS domain-containing protein [Palleronia sediminis]
MSLPVIVGIGASAGGLSALKAFAGAIPPQSGLAYVVVQHHAPGGPAILGDLLNAQAAIPASAIEDGGAILPDRIHVLPPGVFVEIDGGRFRLLPHAPERGVRTPIDRFFDSLAATQGTRAVAVILSGTGADGTAGVRAVKARGGMALVQGSGDARFPAMPESAAATGLVDEVSRAAEMPGRILWMLRHRRAPGGTTAPDTPAREIETRLPEILDRLAAGDGPSFAGYKPGTLVRRVLRRMAVLRAPLVDAYLAALAASPAERTRLGQEFLIGVTRFFRDPPSFAALRDAALAPLLGRGQDGFRVWVPGCSTGEEVYSIAMQVADLRRSTGDRRPWKIFGTDIDRAALERARAGRFAEDALAHVPPDLRAGCIAAAGGGWKVSPELREMCVFAPHDLLGDPPFSRLDLISCRNVMIYLTADSQHALLQKFHYGLGAGGYLWLGPSETLGRSDTFFHTVSQAHRIYRRDDTIRPGFSAIADLSRHPVRPPAATRKKETPMIRGEVDLEDQAERLFLRRAAAPFAVVNRNDDMIYLSEAMTAFVRPSGGAVGIGIEDLLSRELRLPVQSAIRECRETGADAEIRDVTVGAGLFDVIGTPFPDDSDRVLVALNEVRLRDMPGPDTEAAGADADQGRELALARRRLTTLQRDYEGAEQKLRSTNEELLSMNEELQSSNEEIETSREELQSINEELETINAELSEKNRRLVEANSNLKNLLESTRIATLFIDQNDCLRLFTPEVTRLYGVQHRDIGRSIHDLASTVDYPQLREDAAEVRRTLQPVEREVRIEAEDRTFMAQLRPYRTVDDRLDGVVVLFIDLTDRIRAEREAQDNTRLLRERYAELESLYDKAPVGLSLMTPDLRWLRINEALAAINGFPVADHIGAAQADLIPETHARIADIQRRVIATREPSLGHVVSTRTPADPERLREFTIDYYPVIDEGEVFALGCCVHEITRQREMEREIAENEARMRRIFDQAPVGIAMHEGADLVTVYANPMMLDDLGGADLLGRPALDAVPDAADSDLFAAMREVFATGRPSEAFQTDGLLCRFPGDTGRRVFQCVVEPWVDRDGTTLGVITFAKDITAEALAQERERDSRERLQRLQDSLRAFVGMLDPDGTLTEVNATALERGGLTREDVIGRKFWNCYWWSWSDESRERLEAAVARAAAGEEIRYDAEVRMADDLHIVIDFQLVPIRDAAGRVAEIVPSGVDITQRLRAEERKDVLLSELEHRVKNVLATVQAVVRFTARMSDTAEEMAENMRSRIAAISRCHDALSARDWEGQTVRQLVEAEIAPYADHGDARFVFDGPDVMLDPTEALSLGLAFHELATNAAKYGAFSTPEGQVRVAVEPAARGFARLEWRETGGPPVAAPAREGFGSFLIGRLLERELDAEVTVDYAENGLICIVDRVIDTGEGEGDAR